MEISKGGIHQGRTLLHLYNSSDDTQPHSITANYMVQANRLNHSYINDKPKNFKQNPRLCPKKNIESPVHQVCEIHGALHRFKTLIFPRHPTANIRSYGPPGTARMKLTNLTTSSKYTHYVLCKHNTIYLSPPGDTGRKLSAPWLI